MVPTVLIADDDPAVRDLLAGFLHAEGYEPLLATGGTDVLALLEHLTPPPAVLLLDLVMPDVDGYAVLTHLRHTGQDDLPILIFSGYPPDTALLAALGAGRRDFIANTLKQGLAAGLAGLDGRSGRVRQAPLPGCQPNDTPRAVALDARRGRVFVACGRVQVLDAASGKLLHAADVGAVPAALAVDAGRGLVFVAALAYVNSSDDPAGPGRLSVLDATSGAVLAQAPVGWGPVAVSENSRTGQVVVTTRSSGGGDTAGAVNIFNVRTLLPTRRRGTPARPHADAPPRVHNTSITRRS